VTEETRPYGAICVDYNMFIYCNSLQMCCF